MIAGEVTADKTLEGGWETLVNGWRDKEEGTRPVLVPLIVLTAATTN